MNLLILILGLIGLAERVIKWILIQQFFQKAKLESESFLPLETYTISILQPILSGDPTLWDCLSHNLALKTSDQLEFIWLLEVFTPSTPTFMGDVFTQLLANPFNFRVY